MQKNMNQEMSWSKLDIKRIPTLVKEGKWTPDITMQYSNEKLFVFVVDKLSKATNEMKITHSTQNV